jgi:hypothetical protein
MKIFLLLQVAMAMLACLAGRAAPAEDPLDHWQQLNPDATTSAPTRAIGYGQGQFWGLSSYNELLASTNARQWTAFSDLLRADAPGSGIFTSVSGSTHHRIFNIEWRVTYFTAFGPPGDDTGKPVNFEVRLYEDQPRFDIIYGELNGDGSTAGVGVQQDTGSAYTSFECHTGGLSPGLQLAFRLQPSCIDGGGICAPLNGLPLILSPTLGGVEFSFSFETLAGKNYVVQFKDSLDDRVWQTLQSVPGDGNPKKITNPVSAARQRFYRLRAE